MKTVTIPTSQSPFVVMVNGAKYVYPAGSVQDVPDEVAVVIEAHNKQTAKPNEPVEAPFDCDCGGGGSLDWNDIKNKPFGEGYGDTLTIEAIDLDNLDFSTLVGGLFLKVADTPVTMNDLANGYSIRLGSDTIEVPPEAVGESAVQFVDGITLISESFLSVEEQGVGVEIDGIVFAEIGIYIIAEALAFDIDITVPGFGKFTVIQKLDEKYIPSIPASKLPANAINVQPDCNQTDETAMDFIRNKPVLDKLRLYTVTSNSVTYITDTHGGEPLTAEQFVTHITGYTADKILVNNNLCVGLVGVENSYYSIAYFDFNVKGTFSVYHAYTAEYTGS